MTSRTLIALAAIAGLTSTAALATAAPPQGTSSGSSTAGAKSTSGGSSAPASNPAAPSSKTKDSTQAALDRAVASTVHIQHARALSDKGNYAAAEDELLAADKATPDYCPILEELSTVQFRQGKTDAALESLERAIRRGKGFEDRAYLLTARIFSGQKRFAEGEKKLIEWAADRPVTANFHAAIGILRLGALELGPAEIEMREALKLDPGNEAALTAMAQLYGRLRQFPRLQPFLDKGVAAKPRSVSILMLAGNNLLSQERFAEAKDHYENILKLDPKNAAAQVNLGSCLHGMGDTAGAMRSFRKAIELDPKGIEAPINLALALERDSKPSEARDILLVARAQRPENLDVLNALAMAYHLNGQLDEAITSIRDSLVRDPEQPQMKKLLAQIESEKTSSGAPGKPAGP